jgi:hypothetical protein
MNMSKYTIGMVIFLIVLAFIFISKDTSAKLIDEENKQVEENLTLSSADDTTMVVTYAPNKYYRTVTVGDLPIDHDPSLVLKKGRNVAITLRFNDAINSELSEENTLSFYISKGIYDDSGQVLLVPKGVEIYCTYKASKEQDRIKIDITAYKMVLESDGDMIGVSLSSVVFTNPPRCTTGKESREEFMDRWRASMRERASKYLAGEKYENKEFMQLREQLFSSPVICAELVFDVKSEDCTSESEKVIFGKNDSGDRTVIIKSGYQLELQVMKDILFSGPYVNRW